MKHTLLVITFVASLLSGTEVFAGGADQLVRPFYIGSCSEDEKLITATVINTTGENALMRFWVTGTLTRLDDSEYFGCDSVTPLKLEKCSGTGDRNYATYWLGAGENHITLQIKDYGDDCAISQLYLNGGRSSSRPLMPAYPIVQDAQIIEAEAVELAVSSAESVNVATNVISISITNSPTLISTPPLSITITNRPSLIIGLSPTPILLITNQPSPVITNLPPMTITNTPPEVTIPPTVVPWPPLTTFSGCAISTCTGSIPHRSAKEEIKWLKRN